MRHRRERKYIITIICFDKHFWSVCVCAIPFKMYMYVPCLSTCVWLPTASTAFLGDVYGISTQIEKIGVEVDTILRAKLLTPLFIVCQRITTL